MPSRKRKVGEKELENPKQLRAKRLEAQSRESLDLKTMIEGKPWKTTVQPLIDKMIDDTIGGKREDGTYMHGLIGEQRYDAQYLLGYRMAIMDFNNRIRLTAASYEKLKEQMRDLKEDKEYKPEATAGKTVTVTTYGNY